MQNQDYIQSDNGDIRSFVPRKDIKRVATLLTLNRPEVLGTLRKVQRNLLPLLSTSLVTYKYQPFEKDCTGLLYFLQCVNQYLHASIVVKLVIHGCH